MKLLEFIITETAEEDRAIISLSSFLAAKLQAAYSAHGKEDFTLGKIGKVVETPLQAVNDITIKVGSEETLLSILGKTKDSGSTAVTSGVWDPNTDTIWINVERLEGLRLRLIRIISHELRHALDDMKSDYRASESDRYDTPKNPAYRKIEKDPYYGNVAYLAKPSEINARFVEVLTLLSRSMAKDFSQNGSQGLKDRAINDLYRFLEKKRILNLFPEREQSKDYKRLLKRAVEFIDKEVAYLETR